MYMTFVLFVNKIYQFSNDLKFAFLQNDFTVNNIFVDHLRYLLKRKVLRHFLNTCSLAEDLNDKGREFQTEGPNFEKDLSP